MDALYLHLLLNHFPVVGTMIGIALLAFGLTRKSLEVKRVGLAVFLVIALITIPVYSTGEPSQERVEKSPGISKTMIEQHEDPALHALIAMELTGCVALIGLFLLFRKSHLARWSIVTVLVLSLITLGLMARTANLGGQIRHQEIRSGKAQTNSEKPAKPESKKDDDDDHKD